MGQNEDTRNMFTQSSDLIPERVNSNQQKKQTTAIKKKKKSTEIASSPILKVSS